MRQHGDNGWQLALLAMYFAIRPIAGTSSSWPGCHVPDAQVIVSADCRLPPCYDGVGCFTTASVASHDDRCKRRAAGADVLPAACRTASLISLEQLALRTLQLRPVVLQRCPGRTGLGCWLGQCL